MTLCALISRLLLNTQLFTANTGWPLLLSDTEQLSSVSDYEMMN